MKAAEGGDRRLRVAIGEALLPAVTSLVHKAGVGAESLRRGCGCFQTVGDVAREIAVGVALAGVAIAVLGGR